MPENIITGANDVELVIKSKSDGGGTVSTADELGRIVVDDFSITREEGSEAVSGVGTSKPLGATNGDESYGWSFTIMGSDVGVFNMVATKKGASRFFSFTATKSDEEGNVEFEYSLDWCKETSGEFSGSTGEATEYAAEGFALSYDRT